MVCPWCDGHLPLDAERHLELLVDKGAFHPLGAPAGSSLFGQATLAGHEIALALADPTALWTPAECRALLALAEVARRERHPLVWVATAAQGATPALWPGLQAALQALHQVAVPWLTLVAGPCYGSMAALALQSDLVLAEPGAFLDPLLPAMRRQAGLAPEPLHRPRQLLRAGWADAVLPRSEQRAGLALLLDLLLAPGPSRPRGARRLPQPEVPAQLQALFGPFFELHGDRRAGDDPTLVGGLGRLREDGRTVVVLAALSRKAIGAAGWRKAARLLGLAGRLGLPVVTLIDRPVLRASRSEAPGETATALGETLQALLDVPTPTIAVILGDDEGLAMQVLGTADGLLCSATVASRRQDRPTPDATFDHERDLPGLLARHLEELTQTYVIHGPLGRRKLLQRRYIRWIRPAQSEMDQPEYATGEQS